MLPTSTPFPQVGSYALLTCAITGPDGRRAGASRRLVRIQQVMADGRYFVTASGRRVVVGNRAIDVPAIQRSVTRAELAKPRAHDISGHAAGGAA